MCFHSKQSKDAQSLDKRFKAKVTTSESVTSERFNGFVHPKTPVIAHTSPDAIQLFSWGLIPFWAKDKSIQKNTLNARIETIKDLPSFRNAVKNRCLVIVDGFFEWQWLDPDGKKNQQYMISLPSENAFAFAGIYSEWTDKTTGEILNTYTIVTTEADPFMAEIHNTKKRMPVILTPENERDWLSGAEILDFAKPEVELKAIPV
jgi:putative SOS response-associated peptidase YedK